MPDASSIISQLIEAILHAARNSDNYDKLAVGLYSTLLGILATIGVAIGRWIIRLWRSVIDQHIVTQTLELRSRDLSSGDASQVKIYCLVVRYGTDLYFEKLASDQERYEGRLQNRILHNWVTDRWSYDRNDRWTLLRGARYLWHRLQRRRVIDPSSDTIQTLFHLPIHDRLGTQFKFSLR